MAIRQEHIHIETIRPEAPPGHEDGSRYATVTFRVFDPHHPNSFVVPVSVNLDQFPEGQVEDHARCVFHHFMRTLAEETRSWDELDRAAVRA